jgi:hypothetical protein
VEEMNLNEAQRKFSYYLGKFIIWAYSEGYEFAVGEVLRTPEQQKIYLDTGRSLTSKSDHLNATAFDISLKKTPDIPGYNYITDPAAYKPLGDFWKSLDKNNRWGGDFKGLSDPFHFELHVI